MSMEPVLHSFVYALDYLEELLADVAEADRSAQPHGIRNHPAWVLGHLTFSCQLLGEVIGVTSWLPEDWGMRFGPGSLPGPEPDAYESKTELLRRLREARKRVIEGVRRLDDVRLHEPFPDANYRVVFPTIRHALTQVMVAHTAFHVGQVATWRRAMGLPAISRGFE